MRLVVPASTPPHSHLGRCVVFRIFLLPWSWIKNIITRLSFVVTAGYAMKFLIIAATAFALFVPGLGGAAPEPKWMRSSPPLTPALATDGGISFSLSPIRKISKPKLRLFCTVFVDCVSVVGGADTCAAGSSSLNSNLILRAGTLTSTYSLSPDSFMAVLLDSTGGKSPPEQLLRLLWLPLGVLVAILLRIFRRQNSQKKPRERRHSS